MGLQKKEKGKEEGRGLERSRKGTLGNRDLKGAYKYVAKPKIFITWPMTKKKGLLTQALKQSHMDWVPNVPITEKVYMKVSVGPRGRSKVTGGRLYIAEHREESSTS